jgi:hypothetical protein
MYIPDKMNSDVIVSHDVDDDVDDDDDDDGDDDDDDDGDIMSSSPQDNN